MQSSRHYLRQLHACGILGCWVCASSAFLNTVASRNPQVVLATHILATLVFSHFLGNSYLSRQNSNTEGQGLTACHGMFFLSSLAELERWGLIIFWLFYVPTISSGKPEPLQVSQPWLRLWVPRLVGTAPSAVSSTTPGASASDIQLLEPICSYLAWFWRCGLVASLVESQAQVTRGRARRQGRLRALAENLRWSFP